MWPFPKKHKSQGVGSFPVGPISYSQLDTTERFDDNLRLDPADWIPTTPLNLITSSPEAAGLPRLNATDSEVYEIASKLSLLRESASLPHDGVYCPLCHVASIDVTLLRRPCPKCGLELLQFGWD